ncbi:hypothetical protein QQS21_010621 [Conoideocrella luteorostrata]|uniref:TUG ubiquitin-like domain-containing protein n=1 Tax=Conoideocrella luteorostrata TaxID=1105319 RepID=A0AAJ0CEU4_9HYPO|nr:hypothetical protein QQS21_010621 [Conoideocrella luteorostrata]
MASHIVVIATDLRRTTVKVTPGTYLSDVLDQACKKLNLSSNKYLIRHKQKQVDLSVPFRTSGLIAGAKLELVQRSNTPSVVQIALQIPQPEAREVPGGRLIKKFPSYLTLWKVMRQFESGEASIGKNINITARGYASTTSGSGQLHYETPVLNIMGREFSTFDEFQKTLAQLGYNSGNVLIRLDFRRTAQTLFEAMEQTSLFFNDSDEKEDKAATMEVVENKVAEEVWDEQRQQQQKTLMANDAPDAAVIHNSSATSQSEVTNSTTPADQKTTEDTLDTLSPSAAQDPYQPVNIFLAPTGTTPAAALVPATESDFAPTIAHAQLHQARLLQSSRNKRLPSDKELAEKAAADEARIASIKSVLVKIRFPDNTSSEWQVSPLETGAFLHEAVRQVMADPNQPFRLVLSGSTTTIKDNSGQNHNLIKVYKLSGRVLINLVWEDTVPVSTRQQPFLKANIAIHGQEVKVPDLPTVDDETPNVTSNQDIKKDEKKGGGGEGAKKIPRWLKLGKK